MDSYLFFIVRSCAYVLSTLWLAGPERTWGWEVQSWSTNGGEADGIRSDPLSAINRRSGGTDLTQISFFVAYLANVALSDARSRR